MSNQPQKDSRKGRGTGFLPGVTVLSVSTILLGLVAIGLMIQVGNVHADASFMIGGLFALPLRPIIFIVPLVLISGLVFYLTKRSIYTRAEMICVLAALLMAPPIMTEGFWSLAVGGMITIPKTADMAKLDAYSDKMWPHGEDILQGVLAPGDGHGKLSAKGKVSWEEYEVDAGKQLSVPVLSNEQPDQVSSIRIAIPVFIEGKQHLLLDEPYLLTLLARAEGLESESSYYCRIYDDDAEQFASEVFSSSEGAKTSYLHPGGFIRRGSYGVTFSPSVDQVAYVELGLSGRGKVTFADLSLKNVSAVEELFDGRKVVSQDDFDALPEKLRGRVLVKPDSMVSLAGLKMILTGNIPLGDWVNPAIFWLGIIVLLLAGTFTIAVIMRKQWMENERFPMPIAQIPIRLLGLDDRDEQGFATSSLPAIWKNQLMWIGFGVTLFWCVMKIWAAYNSSVPNLSINVPVSPYFNDPSWGAMWGNVNFKVCSIFLALGLFMELNILMSIVLGFFLFRAQYWFGHTYGLTSVAGYPFQADQMNGSYLMYALLVLFFTRKYLWKVLQRAIQGGRREDEEQEVMSYRSAVVGLLLCLAGVAAWAYWAGMGVAGMLVFYVIMLLVSFVAAKLRAECGVPFSTYFPWGVVAMVPLLGGAPLIIPAGFLFIAMISELFVIRPFLLIPGIQVEMIELGRRARAIPRHMAYVCALGLVGAWLVGGWFMLSNAYNDGLGGTSAANAGASSMSLKGHWYRSYGSYIKEANETTVSVNEQAVEERSSTEHRGKVKPPMWAAIFGAGTVTTVAGLRQAFAGFWFHPIGLIVGSSWMVQEAWGSLLLAWLIRLAVLKLGGAATVREKLLPFATGIFLGGTASYFLYVIIVSYLKFFVPGTKSVWWSIWAL